MVVHVLWESDVQHAGQEDRTTMKRHRHTPEQIVRKLREADRLLNEGKDLTEVLRHLEVSESSWNRRRNQYGGMKANEAKRARGLWCLTRPVRSGKGR
jgi:Transposase